jgi:aminopeptidase N
LRNTALAWLLHIDDEEGRTLATSQFNEADNMTDRMGALRALVNSGYEKEQEQALADFYQQWKDDPQVVEQWFAVQSGSTRTGGLRKVHELMEHPAFTIKNPNKVRALIGAFAGQNLINFHAADGSGYRFLADLVIQLNVLNPQIASRQLAPLTRWRKYDSARQALMKAELERILASGELSSDVYEVVSKSLA